MNENIQREHAKTQPKGAGVGVRHGAMWRALCLRYTIKTGHLKCLTAAEDGGPSVCGQRRKQDTTFKPVTTTMFPASTDVTSLKWSA